jgi:hypothetical protein
VPYVPLEERKWNMGWLMVISDPLLEPPRSPKKKKKKKKKKNIIRALEDDEEIQQMVQILG